jgi:chromosome segregation ATPase
MADTRKLDEAFNRFDAALRQFEAALERQNERKSHEESLEAAAEALRLDRSRLAQELDGVRAKASDLVATNHKAVGKIDAAMSRIRAVLHSNSGGS